MKHLIILGDGMADRPDPELDHRTPLMAARTPVMDRLCAEGRCGELVTVPRGLPPGSETANLGVLGYNLRDGVPGRGVLEAASMGIDLREGEMALRANLIALEGEKIRNHSAGHISTKEAAILIRDLAEQLTDPGIRLFPGVSYRHLLLLSGGRVDFTCTPPHDIPGSPWHSFLPRGKGKMSPTANMLRNIIRQSMEILSDHPVNRTRRRQGKDSADALWPWSPGFPPRLKPLQERFGITGAMISAVDLLHGIGRYAGMDSIRVSGATGLHDTNYRGKAEAALRALDSHDLVYLHVEASDEAGHQGDPDLKIRTIESLDREVIAPLAEAVEKLPFPVTMAVLPDHPTPWRLRTHTADPVPFLIRVPGLSPDDVKEYNEESVRRGSWGRLKGDAFIRLLLDRGE